MPIVRSSFLGCRVVCVAIRSAHWFDGPIMTFVRHACIRLGNSASGGSSPGLLERTSPQPPSLTHRPNSQRQPLRPILSASLSTRMSPKQKKEGHSGVSDVCRQVKTRFLGVVPRMSRSGRSSRASSPAPTPDNTQTTESTPLGSSQPATSALSLTSAPKSIVDAAATAPEPINSCPEPSIPESETKDIREKTRQLVEKRLGPKIVDLQTQSDPKVLVEEVRDYLKEHSTDNSRHKSVGRILKRVDKYLQIVDVAIQHHPDVRNPPLAAGKTSDVNV